MLAVGEEMEVTFPQRSIPKVGSIPTTLPTCSLAETQTDDTVWPGANSSPAPSLTLFTCAMIQQDQCHFLL
jgi:hypothetical protein